MWGCPLSSSEEELVRFRVSSAYFFEVPVLGHSADGLFLSSFLLLASCSSSPPLDEADGLSAPCACV